MLLPFFVEKSDPPECLPPFLLLVLSFVLGSLLALPCKQCCPCVRRLSTL